MKKEEWLKFEWPDYHIYQGIQPMQAWVIDYAKFGCPLSKMALTYSKGTTCASVIKREFEEAGKLFFHKIIKKPEIMLRVLSKIDISADNIFKIERKWKDIDFTEKTNKELIDFHKKLFYWDEILWRNGQMGTLLEFHNNSLSEYIRNLIVKKFGKDKSIEYFSILSTPKYKSITERQDEDLIKFAKQAENLEENSKKFKALIKKHTQKYTWMIYGWTGPALNEKYFLENISLLLSQPKLISDIENKLKEKKETLVRQDEILKKFSPKERGEVLMLRKILEAKAKRVDAHSCTYFVGDKIRNEIAKRKYLSINQMRVISCSETLGIFKKNINPDKLNEEYKFVMYWFGGKGGFKKFTGKKALEIDKEITEGLPKVFGLEKGQDLKGEMAYPGKFTGIVNVILEKKDFDKFKNGEILVSRITDPNYLPIMKISKAIITDVGGITCHAAIVARELKIPCVIGTKIATKVLKTGDLVEVDADKGVIKILEE